MLVTILCLSSMGGLMGIAFPVLVPLHWLAARRSGPAGTVGWGSLAALSLFQGGWIASYVAFGRQGASYAVGLAAAMAAVVAFVCRGAHRSLERAAAP